jgi:serine/threonine protein phosphatase PrpC
MCSLVVGASFVPRKCCWINPSIGHGGTFAAAYAGKNFLRVLSRQPKFVAYAKFVKERPRLEAQLQGSARRVQLIRSGLELLEGALCDAFVDLDRELARAARRLPNPEADTPYHEAAVVVDGSENHTNSTDNAATNDQKLPSNNDSQLLEDEGDSGSTACVVLVTPEWIVCANAGDSRAVFSKHGHKAVPLSYDHKPDDEEEERRVRSAGGYVAGGRVEGDLAVSRGFGDFRFKVMDVVLQGSMLGSMKQQDTLRVMRHEDQKVSAVPDIIVQNRSHDQDEFIIIACDGIWDVQTNYEGVKAVAEMFDEGEARVALACEELCDMCLKLGSKDNMTALIIRFPGQQHGQGGGVLARRQQRDDPTAGGETKVATVAGYTYSFAH